MQNSPSVASHGSSLRQVGLLSDRMEEPADISAVDPSAADPSLSGAPVLVRKADAWLAEHNKRTGRRWALMGVTFLPLAGMLGGAGLATMTGSEPTGAVLMLGSWAIAAGALYAIHKAWGATQGWATNVVTRYKQLQEMGVTAEFGLEDAPEMSAIDRMVDRIRALAPPDHTRAAEAAVQARDRARRLEKELVHIDEVATGDPDTDVALDAAKDRIVSELALTRARIAEVYATLLELEAGAQRDATTDLESTLDKLSASLEVEDATKRRQMQRASVAKQAKKV